MNQNDLEKLLSKLIDSWESETVEFKEARNDYSTGEIGKYFSALANEANLRGAEKAWLVFGVNDAERKVVGSRYRPEAERLQSLKQQIAQDTEPRVTMRDIRELNHPDGRVMFFEIPPAPQGIPISWKGHYYARAGESLTGLGLEKLDEIRSQTLASDWSAQIVEQASPSDLDEAALLQARASLAAKYASRFPEEELAAWSDEVLLDRARITHSGRITRAALLLLGKPEAAYYLSPHPAAMTWKLEGLERAYEHFAPPFLLSTTRLFQRIRNIQLRILPEDQLRPIEIAKYDQKIILEALHNCIAHQDYRRNGRIVVTEQINKLIFENEGYFFEGKPEDYVLGEATPSRYRNTFLAQAMVELNMIDAMGYGIHSMHKGQAERYFPMPDYDLSRPDAVRVTIHGGIVDPAYTRLLAQNTELPLSDILALDRVQKKLPLPDDIIKKLRRSGLIEGRKPNLHVSAAVATASATRADYIRTRAFDDGHYRKMITDYLGEFGKASRQEINQLLWNKLSDALDDKQKAAKIANLLTGLRRSGKIRNAASRKVPEWRLVK